MTSRFFAAIKDPPVKVVEGVITSGVSEMTVVGLKLINGAELLQLFARFMYYEGHP